MSQPKLNDNVHHISRGPSRIILLFPLLQEAGHLLDYRELVEYVVGYISFGCGGDALPLQVSSPLRMVAKQYWNSLVDT